MARVQAAIAWSLFSFLQFCASSEGPWAESGRARNRKSQQRASVSMIRLQDSYSQPHFTLILLGVPRFAIRRSRTLSRLITSNDTRTTAICGLAWQNSNARVAAFACRHRIFLLDSKLTTHSPITFTSTR